MLINSKEKIIDYFKSGIKKKLLIFDKKLKSNGINPGTSADLTVATLFFELVTKKQ